MWWKVVSDPQFKYVLKLESGISELSFKCFSQNAELLLFPIWWKCEKYRSELKLLKTNPACATGKSKINHG